MTVPVFSPHQLDDLALRRFLHDIRASVTDRDADSWHLGSIRFGTMNDHYMVQRHFAGSEDKIDCQTIVHLYRDLLTSRQHVVSIIGFTLGKERTLVRLRDHAQAAILRLTFR